MQYLTEAASLNYLPAVFDLLAIHETVLSGEKSSEEKISHWRSKIDIACRLTEEKSLIYLINTDLFPEQKGP